MNELLLKQSIAEHLSCAFSRSSGPGGQNVNKVNSRVQGSISLTEIEGLTEQELTLLRQNLANRIDSNGLLTVSVDTERSQLRNRELAYHRMVSLIISASRLPKKRLPTKASKSSKVRRLTAKKIHGTIKSGRSWTPEQD